ncbi:hypothetical protein PIB30_019507 [Stylosanthes scabra]|uniref:Uncharacterized protein n=1 Tax=Stylosanthes scabra TaxID=79078 RepID=A0ABU6V9R8_9FABA|nr:hypothetical protein [Stylosanthes scabra]
MSNPHTHSAAPCLPILSPFPPRRRRPPRFSALLLPPSVQNSSVFFLLRPVIHRRRTFAQSQQRRPSQPHPCQRRRPFPAPAPSQSNPRQRRRAVEPSAVASRRIPARPSVPAPSNSQPATPSIKSATASTRPARIIVLSNFQRTDVSQSAIRVNVLLTNQNPGITEHWNQAFNRWNPQCI